MNKIPRSEAINGQEPLAKRVFRGLGRVASGAVSGVVAPLSKNKPAEAVSFFDAPAPELPLAVALDRLDASSDEEIIASAMSQIQIHENKAK